MCAYTQKTFDPSNGRDVLTRISLFNSVDFSFPTGLHARVIKSLKSFDYKIKITDYRDKVNVNVEELLGRADEFGLALRDYQIDGILSGIDNSCGLFNLCTGAGKTALMSFLLSAYDKPSLILVNRKELMEQIARELSSMTKRTVGIIGDGVWQPSKWTVAIVNSLNKGIKSTSPPVFHKTRRFLESIQVFVGDEIHHLGAATWKHIAGELKNAAIRFGFSGTCFHPDSEDIYLVAYTGEIIANIRSSDLIKMGYLAQPHIYMPKVDPTPKLAAMNYRDWHQTRKWLIRENTKVTESGVKFIKKMYDAGRSCIYFAGDDVEYGHKIQKMILDSGIRQKDVRYATGQESTEVRRKILDDFRNHRFQILGGTSIYDEGIDIPHTGSGANFGQGFSEIKTVQRIGRILRKTKAKDAIDVDVNEKQIKYYWDPFNNGNRITSKHSEFRKSIYESQEEFIIHTEME
jgi:superfamily II DNA or RNA helicase